MLHVHKESRLRQRHSPKLNFDFLYFYKNIYKKVVYIYIWKYFPKQTYLYGFYISKLNKSKVSHDLYF